MKVQADMGLQCGGLPVGKNIFGYVVEEKKLKSKERIEAVPERRNRAYDVKGDDE